MKNAILLLVVSIIIPLVSTPYSAANDFITSNQPEESGITQEQVDRLILRVKDTITSIRGLDFKRPTKRGIKNREELKAYLVRKTRAEMPKEKMYAAEKALVKLGFIPPDLDLQNFILDLYTEQVAGFYDWHVGTLYLIKEVPVDLQEMVIVHEMTHALQDITFNLNTLPLEKKDNDDLVLATQALLEGEALLVMIDYMLKPMGVDSSSLPNVEMLLQQATGLAGMGTLRHAPIWIKKNMLFPYLEGFSFVNEIKTKRDGWRALDKCYATLPESTEQILHPEKYLIEHDAPTPVSLPKLSEQLGEGWTFLDENVLGEFNVDLLFHQHLNQENYKDVFAFGWDGDKLQVYENKELRKVTLAWLTTWDSDNDAKEFFDGYCNIVKNKYNVKLVSNDTPNFFLWETQEDMVYLELKEHDVLILEGVPPRSLNQVVSHAWKGSNRN